jgi:hypothetical protein
VIPIAAGRINLRTWYYNAQYLRVLTVTGRAPDGRNVRFGNRLPKNPGGIDNY